MRTVALTRTLAAVSVGTGLAAGLAGCATSVGAGDGPTDTAWIVYGARAFLIQAEGGEPELCLGGVAESYPPQCSGPVVVGLDWDDVPDAETASGVTWGSGWVVGTFDGETFTLTEPVRQEPPEGYEVPEPGGDRDFQPLCDDPWRGGDEEATAADPMGAVGRLQERAAALPGYVELYVSDGASEFNVLLTPDADVEAAHTSLREVWPGWLCVGTIEDTGSSSRVPTNAEAMAASEALASAVGDDWAELGLLSWGPDTIGGTFDVQVVLETPDLRDRIELALAPWYSADRVRITSALVPLP